MRIEAGKTVFVGNDSFTFSPRDAKVPISLRRQLTLIDCLIIVNYVAQKATIEAPLDSG